MIPTRTTTCLLYTSTEEMRTQIEKNLHMFVTDNYGMTELGGPGAVSYTHLDVYKRQQYSEELINEADAHSDTEDEEILEARKTFQELNNKYKEATKGEAEAVREAGGLYILSLIHI